MRILIVLLLLSSLALSKEQGFTQKDRGTLIRVETALKVFMEQVDKRFEQIDKRFEQIDKRFEQIDKRFEQVDKRFEQIDKRFEQINKRFDDLVNFLWMIVGIFTTLTAVVIGFAYWDRRTIISEAKRQTIEELERETKPEKLRKILNALRELAEEDEKVAKILKREGLL